MDAEVLEVIFQGTDSYDQVLQNVILETTGRHGSSIVWYSPRPTVISSTGHVTNPINGQVPVPLTAIISKGNFQKAKSFLLIVKPIHHEVVPPFSPVPIPVLPKDSYDDETSFDNDQPSMPPTLPIYEHEQGGYKPPSNTEERVIHVDVVSPIDLPLLPYNRVAPETAIKLKHSAIPSIEEPEIVDGHFQRANNSDDHWPEAVDSLNNDRFFWKVDKASILVPETVATIEGEKSASQYKAGLSGRSDPSTTTLTEQKSDSDSSPSLYNLLLAFFLSLIIATGAGLYVKKRAL
jgi:hypothetical protein